MSTLTQTRRPARADVRSGLLASAAELFVEQGYEATSVEQVARAAGFTKGAVYSNFGGKPELFAQVCRDRFKSASAPLLELVEGVLEREDRGGLAVALARALMSTVEAGEWQIVVAEFRSLARRDARLSELYDEIARDRESLLAARLDHGPLRGTTEAWRATAASIVLAQINVLTLERLARGDRLPAAEAERTLAVLLEGLLP